MSRFETHREMLRKSAKHLDECKAHEKQYNADAECDLERQKKDEAYQALRRISQKNRKR